MAEISKMDMRDAFFPMLYELTKKDKDIVILSNDFGAPTLDRYREDFPDQFVNAAISEQNMVSTAAGLAMSGKKVIVYSITAFMVLRALEQIKLDICSMNLPVVLLGVGTGYAYNFDGPSHNATEDLSIIRSLANITIYSPSDPSMVSAMTPEIMQATGPTYLRLDRSKWPVQRDYGSFSLADGLIVAKPGKDLAIVATGSMVHCANAAADLLATQGIDACVIDVYRPKPLNTDLLMGSLKGVKAIIAIDEQSINGGLSSIVAEAMADNGVMLPLKRIGIEEPLLSAYGERNLILEERGLDAESVASTAAAFFRQHVG